MFRYPELANFWRLCYVHPSQSQHLDRQDSQSYWISSNTEVDQGDGSAPALFVFGTKPCAEALLKPLQLVAQNRPVLSLLYLDNIIVAVPRDMADVIPLAKQAFGTSLDRVTGAGPRFKLSKCKLGPPLGQDDTTLPQGIQWNAGAFAFLGWACHELGLANCLLDVGMLAGATQRGISDHWEAISSATTVLAQRAFSIFEASMDIADTRQEVVMNTAQIVSLLLRYCIEPKLLYLLRAYLLHMLQTQVEAIDRKLQELIFSISFDWVDMVRGASPIEVAGS